MLRCNTWFVLVVGLVSLRASAYVDLAPTLSRTINDSQTISLIEVEKFSQERGAVLLKKLRDLKGNTADEPIRHLVARQPGNAVPPPVMAWAEPGRRGVLFVSSGMAVVCFGEGWYQVQSSSDGWWKLAADRPDLPLSYYGSVTRLSEAIVTMLAGKTAVITTIPHGADSEGASFDLALNRTALPGLMKVQRIRANLRMPTVVLAVSANPAYLIGAGPVDEEELPALIEKLNSADPLVREETADDLRSLGAKAAPATAALKKLLDDRSTLVRMAAAAALLRISPEQTAALEVLSTGLTSTEAIDRRHAARGAGLAGAPAAPLAGKLSAMLADSDEIARSAALQAIATLGPDAAGALEGVARLLDDPATTASAADALGRIGPAARPALKKLAALLSADQAGVRWAACRAMAQIGGDDARPAVDFMLRELRNPTEFDGYNMMIYLGLLGPVAKDALPVMENLRIKNQPLRMIAMWAIEPERRFPWLSNDRSAGMMRDADFARYIFESFLREVGEGFRPAGKALAARIIDGSAGEVPLWGYNMLARFSSDVVPVLAPALADADIVKRERAAVALGYMGSAASSARPQIAAAITKAPTEREQRLLQWALRKVDAK